MIVPNLCNQDSYDYISTEEVLADSLTEGLKPMMFMKHVENMGLVKSFDVLSQWELYYSFDYIGFM